jgi:anti-sigma factor RsiW
MDCHDARPLIQDDLDGRLERADRERLAAHLEACAECRDTASELRELRELFRAVPPVPAPAGFQESVMARVPRPRGRLLRLAPWLTAVAAAAAVIVAVSVGPLSSRSTDVARAPQAAADMLQEEAENDYDDEAARETLARAARRRETRPETEELGPPAESKELDDAVPPPASELAPDADVPGPGGEPGGRRDEGASKG